MNKFNPSIYLILILLLIGCVNNSNNFNSNNFNSNNSGLNNSDEIEYNFSIENIMSIVSKDVEYSEFVYFYPDFKPNLKSYFPLSKEDYLKLKGDWVKDSEKQVFVDIIDNIKLNDSTYFVEITSLDNNKYSLVSIIDMDKNVSLKIISLIKVEMGV